MLDFVNFVIEGGIRAEALLENLLLVEGLGGRGRCSGKLRQLVDAVVGGHGGRLTRGVQLELSTEYGRAEGQQRHSGRSPEIYSRVHEGRIDREPGSTT